MQAIIIGVAVFLTWRWRVMKNRVKRLERMESNRIRHRFKLANLLPRGRMLRHKRQRAHKMKKLLESV